MFDPPRRPVLSVFPLVVSALIVASPPISAQEGTFEFEVVSVDPASFTVRARDVGSDQEIQFRLPPRAFVGTEFDAEVEGLGPGQRFSARGAANARVQAEAPQGWERRQQAAGRADPPGRERGGAYRVTRVTGEEGGFVVTARGPRGEDLSFRVDASAFEGYRFVVDAESLARGRPFELVAPNRAALRDCCVLLPAGG